MLITLARFWGLSKWIAANALMLAKFSVWAKRIAAHAHDAGPGQVFRFG